MSERMLLTWEKTCTARPDHRPQSPDHDHDADTKPWSASRSPRPQAHHGAVTHGRPFLLSARGAAQPMTAAMRSCRGHPGPSGAIRGRRCVRRANPWRDCGSFCATTQPNLRTRTSRTHDDRAAALHAAAAHHLRPGAQRRCAPGRLDWHTHVHGRCQRCVIGLTMRLAMTGRRAWPDCDPWSGRVAAGLVGVGG